MRRRRQLEQDGVADDLVEIDGVVIEEVGLAVDRVGLEQLVDADRERALDGLEAAAALGRPDDVDLAPHDDALGDALERRLDVDGALGRDRDRARRQIGERGVDLNVALGPRPAQEVGDDDSQTGRNGHLATIVQGPRRRTAGGRDRDRSSDQGSAQVVQTAGRRNRNGSRSLLTGPPAGTGRAVPVRRTGVTVGRRPCR